MVVFYVLTGLRPPDYRFSKYFGLAYLALCIVQVQILAISCVLCITLCGPERKIVSILD